ncbi:MAG: ATP-binding protein [Gammaproteobacteria bacterium]|nr:ATP-binding protein [Gammaproteobacteria bacterium]
MATGRVPAENQLPPPRPPAQAASSACAPHRYNSVKRFVRGLKVRAPERFDVLECLPGEAAQVDFGQGALTLKNGKYRRPYLFVMTLKYSGKGFRKAIWKADQETWARLHEEAFRTFGGAVAYVVLDNLKQGVIRPDLYEPELNAVYAALLAPWEERWAAPRIHGRKKRQVLAMFAEEQPYLKPLPVQRFRYFKQETRTVDEAGLVQVRGAYYAALPAPPHREVTVCLYERETELERALRSLHLSGMIDTLDARALQVAHHEMDFIEARKDALFIGPPGLGKSHCAKALAQLAVQRGDRVLYRDSAPAEVPRQELAPERSGGPSYQARS